MAPVRVSVVAGKQGRVVLARILRDTDLHAGILEICATTGIVTGAIVTAIGSLRKAEVSWAIPSEKTRRGSERMSPVQIEGPVEVLSAQGVVCVADPDMPVIHLHGVVCDAKGQVRGGHLLSGNNPVHSTMDVVVMEIDGARIEAEYDAEIDLVLPAPKALSEVRRE